MFAYLTEMLLYRQNQITPELMGTFLKLINGPEWAKTQVLQYGDAWMKHPEILQQTVQQTVQQLRSHYRAVTHQDFEALAVAAAPEAIARAHCLPRRNLELTNPATRAVDQPGHVSVVVVPHHSPYQPNLDLNQTIWQALDSRRLLTTQIHVVNPYYLDIGVRLTLVLQRDAQEEETRQRAVRALQAFFDPLTGGSQKAGWPFGRSVYVSEIYALLDQVSGVDYVTPTNHQDELVVADAERLVYSATTPHQLIAVTLFPEELINAPNIDLHTITVQSPITPLFSQS
ncbi:baseplate J/gp47 family protein [Leptolyngbya sp. 7M]|uniref:baseplate J/gp47 family protein n=1 Tax=Leptolyngbya sp. 7M TaxID=2812896 RepID=UPI001B8D5855|nr:baseplate J/gp47 family protein [Leptolyngbya sp. 7M]QYO64825.1 baseplate J/gp47 family protein [Leptolyngbya sp. 7M]